MLSNKIQEILKARDKIKTRIKQNKRKEIETQDELSKYADLITFDNISKLQEPLIQEFKQLQQPPTTLAIHTSTPPPAPPPAATPSPSTIHRYSTPTQHSQPPTTNT